MAKMEVCHLGKLDSSPSSAGSDLNTSVFYLKLQEYLPSPSGRAKGLAQNKSSLEILMSVSEGDEM